MPEVVGLAAILRHHTNTIGGIECLNLRDLRLIHADAETPQHIKELVERLMVRHQAMATACDAMQRELKEAGL